MKKILLTIAIVAAVLLTGAITADAAPWVPAENETNPQIVAYYPEGPHSIVGLDGQFEGRDLVMLRGNSGQIQQWFEGIIDGKYAAIHSVWNLSKNGSCPGDWIAVPNAYPQWGDYLVPGATYCVKNNYYQGTK